MDGRGRYHLSTQKLKNWVLEDVRSSINLDRVNNTADLEKPLSVPQEKSVDLKIKKIKEELFPQVQSLFTCKADLVDGVIPLTQIPLKLRDDSQLHVNMSDINSSIDAKVNQSSNYVLMEQERRMLEHEYSDDPHNFKPYIDQEINRIDQTINNQFDSLADAMEPTVIQFLNNRLQTLDSLSTIQDLLDALRT